MKKLSFILTLASGSLLSFAAPAEEISCTASPQLRYSGLHPNRLPQGRYSLPF